MPSGKTSIGMLRVYNTLSREKEEFIPTVDGKVSMYSCGPTVYDVPHLGNYRTFVMSDTIRKYLEYLGFQVNQVVNITDIDDKTITRSGEEELSLGEYTRKYEKIFHEGLSKLNVLPAHHYPRATENVQTMLELVEDLERKGLAYERGGSVYFDVAKFAGYGKLSKLDMSKIRTGTRVDVDEYDKENPRDFALLKKSTESEIERGIFYESKWGKVRPGWHIECSVLAMKHLGEQIDIHTGGVDLIFPHHENEIAQSESHTGKPFAKYWLHGEHLMVGGEKMSKSLGNYITLEDLLKTHQGTVIRYMLISTHYRKILDYTPEFAENSENNYERLKNAHDNLLFALGTAGESGDGDLADETDTLGSRFEEAMNDDFNIPQALQVFHDLARTINLYLLEGRSREVIARFKEVFDSFSWVLGLEFPEPPELTPEQLDKVRQREAARRSKDWDRADLLRDELRDQGITIEDTDWGTKWSTQ
jgi:cysteinyl-tRNA synthetase